MKTLAAICALALLTGCTQEERDQFAAGFQAQQEAEAEARASQPQVVYVQEQPAIPPAYIVPNVLLPMQPPPPAPRLINTSCNTMGFYTSCQSY